MLPCGSNEDYDTAFWPQLRATLDTVLLERPGTYKPISYEQMYSAVYKCVCKQHSEKLYNDVMGHVQIILQCWSEKLHNTQSSGDPVVFIQEFEHILTQYFHALGSIVPIFTYLNRFYVESKLNTDLPSELHQLFARTLSDGFIGDVLSKSSTAL
jgi:hypothetical protein